MEISRDDAVKLFGTANTVEELKALIKKNCLLWFDEDKTIEILNRVSNDRVSFFSTILISPDGPFALVFEIDSDGTISIVD